MFLPYISYGRFCATIQHPTAKKIPDLIKYCWGGNYQSHTFRIWARYKKSEKWKTAQKPPWLSARYSGL